MRALLVLFLLWAWAPAGGPIRLFVGSSESLNPLVIQDEGQNQVLDLLYDRLITMDAKGAFLPQILESWRVSPDNREVILKVRGGLRWHDGSTLDAEDILFTWKLIRSPRMLTLADNQAAGIPSLEKLDALTLRIRLDRPRSTLLAELYNFIPVPRSYPAITNPDTHPYVTRPVGSGPYVLSKASTKQHLILERWTGYRGPYPGTAEQVEFLLGEVQKPTLDMEAGRIHFFDSAGWFGHYIVKSGIRGYRNIVTLQGMREGWRAIWFNCDPAKSVLADARLRKALAELYPLDAITRVRAVWPVQAANCVWPPSSWAYDATPRPLPKRQVAEKLLDEAGWRRGVDGWRRNAQGRELRLEFVVQRSSRRDLIRDAFVEAARDVGIRVEEKAVPFDQTLEAQHKGLGDMWMVGWVNNGPDPNGDRLLFTTDGLASHTNFARYVNPKVDQLFEDGIHATDPEQRALIYRRINQILTADRPLLLIDYDLNYGFHHKDLKGVQYNYRGVVYGFVPGMRGWSLGK